MTEVLDLAEVFTRDTVKMHDGTTYELRNRVEFGLVDDHRLRTLLVRIDEFNDTKDKTEEASAQASAMLRELATMLVVDLETEIPDWACVAIFRFWTARVREQEPADPPKPRRPTTAASSRGSRRSTAATPKRGSSGSPAGR